MSVRDHRNRAGGFRPKHRMPHPEQTDLGTRIHKVQREEDEPQDVQVEQCSICLVWEDTRDGTFGAQGQFLCARHSVRPEEEDSNVD